MNYQMLVLPQYRELVAFRAATVNDRFPGSGVLLTVEGEDCDISIQVPTVKDPYLNPQVVLISKRLRDELAQDQPGFRVRVEPTDMERPEGLPMAINGFTRQTFVPGVPAEAVEDMDWTEED